jgi:hypothetical protein
MSQLEDIVKETRAAFIIAKSDGVLDSSEVIQIAVELAQKISKLANLSGSEKKSVLLHSLKKGLDDSGGLDSLTVYANATPEMKAAFQEQLLGAASASVDLVLSAASGKLDLRKPSSWMPCCFSVVKALLPKEQKLIQDAVKFSEKIVNKDASIEDVVTLVTEIAEAEPALQKVVKQAETVVKQAETVVKQAVEKKVEAVVKKVETKPASVEKKAEVKKDELVKGT